MNEAWLFGSHMGRFSWKDLVWWVKKNCNLLLWKSAHECSDVCGFFAQQRERQNGQQQGVRLSPCLHTHMLTHTWRKTHMYAHILHIHQPWTERIADYRMRCNVVASACRTMEHDHFLLHKHISSSLLYETLHVLCLYEFTGYQSKCFLSSLNPISSLALNHIYPSLSPLLSVHLSPGIQPTPTHLYLPISPYKSLRIYQPSVLVVSNTAPSLFQSQNLHHPLSLSGL